MLNSSSTLRLGVRNPSSSSPIAEYGHCLDLMEPSSLASRNSHHRLPFHDELSGPVSVFAAPRNHLRSSNDTSLHATALHCFSLRASAVKPDTGLARANFTHDSHDPGSMVMRAAIGHTIRDWHNEIVRYELPFSILHAAHENVNA